MIGMAYKDFWVLRKQAGYYATFLVVYAALAILDVFPPSILGGLVVVIGMMLPMSSFSYDDLARWDKYAAATPAGRRGVVGGKYLFALIATLVSAVVAYLAYLAIILTGATEDTLIDSLFAVLLCAAMVLLLDAVTLPLLFKFGAEKSRVISMILFVAVFGTIVGLGALADQGMRLPALPGWFAAALPGVFVLVAVGGFVISYFISRGIYEKKEL